jgi:multicomponent Na+:H+ antiporter subunit C
VTWLLALAVGTVYAAALYLMLRGSLVRLLLGLALVSHGAHLLVFTAGGLVRAGAPLVPEGAAAPPPGTADPLPQALVLTAIVIAFAVLAFALVLARQAHAHTGSDDLADYRGAAP